MDKIGNLEEAIEICLALCKYGTQRSYVLEDNDVKAIDMVLKELEIYKKAITQMAIHLGIADTVFKNMELEEIINHFLGR